MNTIYQEIALSMDAYQRCTKEQNSYADKHMERLHDIELNYLPRGSGFDSGCSIRFASDEKIIIRTAFHHMDENGYYDGWTEHLVHVYPSLMFGFRLRITGKDRNGIKEYIADQFRWALNQEYIRKDV